MHHKMTLQFRRLFAVVMGDSIAIALSYWHDVRLSKCILITRTVGVGGEEEDSEFNSFA